MDDIVSTNVNYTYDVLIDDINKLRERYAFLRVGSIGKSIMGKDIPYIRLGAGNKEVFYSASIHANEWINTVVFMKFIESFSKAYQTGTQLLGYDVEFIFNNVSIYIVPMCNPDGVDLVLGNISTMSMKYAEAVRISQNYPDIPFPNGWKANINGIDLNLQFPANWLEARRIKYEQGYTSPAPRDFVGYGPLTEPESLALYNFTLARNFRLILSYHTQGELIFWKYLDFMPQDAERIANRFATLSGYKLENEADTGSYAGYRDWFISYYNRPGYTIETGLGENPLPLSQVDTIYQKNLGILLEAAIL